MIYTIEKLNEKDSKGAYKPTKYYIKAGNRVVHDYYTEDRTDRVNHLYTLWKFGFCDVTDEQMREFEDMYEQCD